MNEPELQAAFEKELLALEQSGAGMPFTFKPSEGWMLLAALQLVLRHPQVNASAPGAGAFADKLARNIEGRLCKTPAMKEVAARGWLAAYDEPQTKPEVEPEPKQPPPGQSLGEKQTTNKGIPTAPPSRFIRKRK